MFEFQVTVSEDHKNVAEKMLIDLKNSTSDFETIITSFSDKGKINIILACDDIEKNRLSFVISDVISDMISTFFKLDFIEKNLKIPIKNQENLNAFKKALIAFDRETDKYIISRAINIRKGIVLDSFYQFRLKALRNKWLEVIKLANDNASYLLCNDTFVDLLKFLIDNIEISRGTVNIVKKEDELVLCDEEFNAIDDSECLLAQIEEKTEFNLIAALIALSPRKINVYCNSFENNSTLTMISQIFEKRVAFIPVEKIGSKF